MTTRMVHPQHGATHAYDPGEVAKLQGLGWSVEGEKPSAGDNHLALVKSAVTATFPSVATVQRRKPGPKPKAK